MLVRVHSTPGSATVVIRTKQRSHQPSIFKARVAHHATGLHPKGGVGRSATVFLPGAALAMLGHRIALQVLT
jgi:hypothetical protein